MIESVVLWTLYVALWIAYLSLNLHHVFTGLLPFTFRHVRRWVVRMQPHRGSASKLSKDTAHSAVDTQQTKHSQQKVSQSSTVLVQIPLFNEDPSTVRSVLLACARLQWPVDHWAIQVLDDSTAEFAETVPRVLQKDLGYKLHKQHSHPSMSGSNPSTGTLSEVTEMEYRKTNASRPGPSSIFVIRRMARIGFKAGALQEGFLSPSASPFGYFALFDADFQPKPDFLTSLMPRFTTGFVSGGDPKDDAALQSMFDRSSWTTTDPGNVGRGRIGCVQGRWGFLNAEQNMLTRLQYLVLQTHHCIEQHYRCRSGLLMTFNGTGGIWTRECIEQTGGWTFETVCEDLLLSYRAQIRGFRVVYARDVVIPSELPPTLGVFLKQQQRWARGTTQSAKLIIPSLWKAQHFSFGQKAYGTVHLLGYFFFAVFVSVETLGQLLNVPFPLPLLVLLTSMCPLLTQFVMMREIRQMRILLLLPIFYCISQGIQLCVSLSTFYGLFDSVARPGKFTRTPKGQLSSPTKRSKSWWKSVQLLRYEIYLVALWTIHGLMFTAMSFQGVILSIIGIAYYVAAGLDC